MRRFRDPQAFAQFLRAQAALVPAAVQHGLGDAGALVEADARRRFGRYQKGWAPLAEATRADRAAHGFAPNDPLLRTGGLRDSVGHAVSGNAVEIGSPEKVMVWQEMGTSRIPPRPVLGPALAENADRAVRAAVGPVNAVIAGRPLPPKGA